MNLNTDILTDVLNSDEDIKNNTVIGYIEGIFANDEEILKDLKPMTIAAMFDDLCRKVEEVYNEGN